MVGDWELVHLFEGYDYDKLRHSLVFTTHTRSHIRYEGNLQEDTHNGRTYIEMNQNNEKKPVPFPDLHQRITQSAPDIFFHGSTLFLILLQLPLLQHQLTLQPAQPLHHPPPHNRIRNPRNSNPLLENRLFQFLNLALPSSLQHRRFLISLSRHTIPLTL
jgi:hypothetical protein